VSEHDVDGSDPDRRVTTYLCIGCPLGCRLELEETDDHEIVEVRGFSCKKGERFAIQEHTDPRRMVTTTIAVESGRFPRLPVRTAEPVPKALMGRVCEELRSITVEAPVTMGDVVCRDIAGSGVDVIASRDMLRPNMDAEHHR
jgi:CxxC motif-containing protein